MADPAPLRTSLRRVLVALLLVSLAAPVALFAAKPPGGDTPQAVAARMKAAAEHDDFKEMVECIAPAQRKEMAVGLVLGTTMMVAFLDMGSEMAMGMAQGMSEAMTDGADKTAEQTAEQKAAMEKAKAEAKRKADELKGKHEAIMVRYGLKERMAAMQAEGHEAGGNPDEAIGKLLAGVDERALIADLLGFMGAMGEAQGGGEAKKPMTFPTEITDYKITGDQATARAGEETVKFLRVDGRWYLAPDEKSAPPAAE
jgi:hypothetical protein